jgi:hypothetical protein
MDLSSHQRGVKLWDTWLSRVLKKVYRIPVCLRDMPALNLWLTLRPVDSFPSPFNTLVLFFAWRREAAAGTSWGMLAWTPGSEPCKSSIELSLTLRIDFQCLFLPRVMSASTQTKAWADGKVQEGTVPAGGPPSPPVLRLYPPGRRALILTFLFFQELIVQFFSLIIVLKKFLRKF